MFVCERALHTHNLRYFGRVDYFRAYPFNLTTTVVSCFLLLLWRSTSIYACVCVCVRDSVLFSFVLHCCIFTFFSLYVLLVKKRERKKNKFKKRRRQISFEGRERRAMVTKTVTRVN